MYSTTDYAQKPELFIPVWKDRWSPPSWLTDFASKAALMEHRGGRLLSFAHRADVSHYPENSFEAVLSCIAMGVDILELDLRISGDDVPVLSHDATLTRCTNVAEVRKAQPGLFPASDRIRDWRFDQLQQLFLLDKDRQPSPCRMARFADVLQACSGRVMMILDKMEETAEECGLSEPAFWQRHMFPLLERYDSTPSCVKGWHYRMENSVVMGDYEPAFREAWQAELATARCRGKSIEGHTLARVHDHRSVWEEMDRLGVDYIMTNDALGMVRYIAETYAPQADNM